MKQLAQNKNPPRQERVFGQDMLIHILYT